MGRKGKVRSRFSWLRLERSQERESPSTKNYLASLVVFYFLFLEFDDI